MLLRTVFMIGLTLILYAAGSLMLDVSPSQAQVAQQVAVPAVPDAPETPDTPVAVDPLDAPADWTAVQEQLVRAVNTGVATDLQPADVSPTVARQSAAFANFLREQTGAVPNGRTPQAERLVQTSSDRFKPVTDRYYVVWDDLMRRCWDSVSNNLPFDETGLAPHGDERVDYTTAWTEGSWFTTDKAFKVKYKVEIARGTSSGLRRICSITTNRFALVKPDAVALLKDRFDLWFAEEDLQNVSTVEDYPYEIRDGDQYHRVQTHFGSVQGCELIVEYQDIGLLGERDASFYLLESTDQGCEASPRRDGNGVRINRLPQVDR